MDHLYCPACAHKVSPFSLKERFKCASCGAPLRARSWASMMFAMFVLTPILGFVLIYPFRQWWRELTQIAGFIAQSAVLLGGVGLYILVCRLLVRVERDVS